MYDVGTRVVRYGSIVTNNIRSDTMAATIRNIPFEPMCHIVEFQFDTFYFICIAG